MAAPTPAGSNSSRSWKSWWRARIEICRRASARFKGGLIELEYVYPANPPLAIHCLYGDGHCQLRRHGTGRTSRMGGLLATAPALPAAVYWPVHVRAPVCHQVAQRVTHRRTGEDNGANDVEKAGECRKEARRKADAPLRRQSSDREGRRRRPSAGLHRGHAGLETRRRTPPRRHRREHRPRRAQGREMELALLWRRGSGRLVPQLSLLHKIRQSGFLPRHIAALRPLPPGESKNKEVRYLDIHEDDHLDEAQLAAWVKQASQLP